MTLAQFFNQWLGIVVTAHKNADVIEFYPARLGT